MNELGDMSTQTCSMSWPDRGLMANLNWPSWLTSHRPRLPRGSRTLALAPSVRLGWAQGCATSPYSFSPLRILLSPRFILARALAEAIAKPPRTSAILAHRNHHTTAQFS
jgi:hypothetical protein